MLRAFKDNPILLHQMRHARWPSLQTAIWIAAGLTVIELALTITAFPLSPRLLWLFVNSVIIVLIEILLLIIGPLLTGIVAVLATGRAINSEAYQIVRLSQITEHQVVKGYVVGALFRLRAMWMIASGLMLPLIVAVTHLIVADVPFFFCLLIGGLPASAHCTPSAPATFAFLAADIVLIYVVCIAALFVAWNRLAATLGVWLAFRLRYTVRALLGLLLLLVIFIALQAYLLFIVSAFPLVVLMFAGLNLSLVGWANQEAVRACEAYGSTSENASLPFEG